MAAVRLGKGNFVEVVRSLSSNEIVFVNYHRLKAVASGPSVRQV